MKIVEMRVTPVAMADPPLLNMAGLHAPYALRTIVELVSEDGLTGVGETHGGERSLAHFEQARDAVVGRDVVELGKLWQGVNRALAGDAPKTSPLADESAHNLGLRAYSALEVAALDLIGKAVGRPVCDLLGGRVRDEVSFSAYLFYKLPGGGGEGEDAREDRWGPAPDPDGIARQAREMIAEYGFGSVKLKGGVYPPDEEIAAMHALRDALGPDVPLRIDPNGAWTAETSIRVGTELADVLEYLEDPATGLEEMSAVRRALLAKGIETPIATNAVSNFTDVPEMIRLDACQVVLGDHHTWGGPRAVTQLGRICETFGLGLSMHSNSHLGVTLLAMTHLAAATANLTYASDTHYPWQYPEDEILEGGRVSFRNGAVRVPDAPGLGAEIDRDALARGKERYDRCAYRKRDDAIEMRKHVDPNWQRLSPRW